MRASYIHIFNSSINPLWRLVKHLQCDKLYTLPVMQIHQGQKQGQEAEKLIGAL